MPAALTHKLRADAEDNRDRILDAARRLFALHGLDVSMREIARHANVGPATLYRRFPTKRDLIDEAFRDEMVACARIVQAGCADGDPWAGLTSVIVRMAELSARNQGFTDAFLDEYPDAIDFTEHRVTLLRSLADLISRAHASGRLRRDFSLDDLLLVLMAGRGIAVASTRTRVAAARRFATLTVDGLRAENASALPPRVNLTRSVVAP